MQVIFTKYQGPTNYRGSRVKAWVPDESPEHRESVTLSWDDALNTDENHNAALRALCAKHDKAFAEWLDAQPWRKDAGPRCFQDGWSNADFVRGATDSGYAYVRLLSWNVVKGGI